MKKYILTIITTIAFLTSNATIRYAINSSGLSSGSGLTPATALSFTYAISSSGPVVAGDIVYVKAGYSYTTNCTFTVKGSTGLPISFIGYINNPGDVTIVGVDKADPFAALSNSVMPTFTGASRTSGVGFDLSSSKYINFKNFQLQNYSKGIYTGKNDTSSSHFNFDNITIKDIGDQSASYNGIGIELGSAGTDWSFYNRLTRCLVVNACAENIGVYGDHNYFYRCKTYCNDNSTGVKSATDYYFVINGSDNYVDSCYIYRTSGLGHLGHGFSIRTNVDAVGVGVTLCNAKRNVITRCDAVNMQNGSYELRHSGCQYNVVTNCRAYGTHVDGGIDGEGIAISIRDNAKNNIINSIKSNSCYAGISFSDSDEETATNGLGSGLYNKIVNCIFYNGYFAIMSQGSYGNAGDNLIANCTFVKNEYHLYCKYGVADLRFNGDIFYGGASDGYWHNSDSSATDVGSHYTDCSWYSITGSMPGGFVAASINGQTSDPKLVNTTTDFRLQATSPCIGTNTTTPSNGGVIITPESQFASINNGLSVFNYNKYFKMGYPKVTRDFTGKIRPTRTESRGAFEY